MLLEYERMVAALRRSVFSLAGRVTNSGHRSSTYRTAASLMGFTMYRPKLEARARFHAGWPPGCPARRAGSIHSVRRARRTVSVARYRQG